MTQRPRLLLLALALVPVIAETACDIEEQSTDTGALTDVFVDAGDSSNTDATTQVDVDDDQDPGDTAIDDTPTEDATTDTFVDVPIPALPTKAPIATPQDPLSGTEVESCAVYMAEREDGEGGTEICAVYDPATSQFVDEPDAQLKRALLFDRWRDLYNSPQGQAIDRDFTVETLPGSLESEWGDAAKLAGYLGAGDGGIWTGWSTVAAILRYSQTGTEADYLRMERSVRDLLTMYEVTGVPGYLCRYHFLLMPDGAPVHPEIIIRHESTANLNHHDRLVAEDALQYLPSEYVDGYADAEGTIWKGTPMWHGRPSIDQNTGPMTALPMAYDLLKDQDLKDRIAYQLTCYLKRLQRIELINLQDNPNLLTALMSYFSAGELMLDPDDIDLTKLDTIVAYVNRQVNVNNEAEFDYSCPDTVQMEPWRVIDATSDYFLFDLLDLVSDMDTDDDRATQIDHYYFPSIRGGDAMHLMHLATMAYHFTGDEQYREFLYRELIGNIKTDQVAGTAGAFDLPKFCKKYYGDQITYGPWWAFLHEIGDCDLKTSLQDSFYNEMWLKLQQDLANADLGIMIAGTVPEEIATDKDEILAKALELLEVMGGNGWDGETQVIDDPRRAYSLTPEFIMAHADDGVEAICPTQAEIDICTAEIDFMGVKLPGLGVGARACSGSEWECVVGENECVRKMTSQALPPNLRPYTDFLWQRNPFEIGVGAYPEGHRQYAGSDYSEPYWNARRYGFITAGQGQVLAWKKALK